MGLREYFEGARGIGILATADDEGHVDAAIYSRPHILEDGSVAFVMRDRLTHHNLQTNPKALYLFVEEGGGYRGRRLVLTKLREEGEGELLTRLHRRKWLSPEADAEKGAKFLVVFRLERELPLIGDGSS